MKNMLLEMLRRESFCIKSVMGAAQGHFVPEIVAGIS